MNPGVIALMIPILALMIPIIAILLKHQKEMAEMMRQDRQALGDARIDALQAQIADLKDLVHQQTIALDRMSTPVPSSDVRQRVSGT